MPSTVASREAVSTAIMSFYQTKHSRGAAGCGQDDEQQVSTKNVMKDKVGLDPSFALDRVQWHYPVSCFIIMRHIYYSMTHTLVRPTNR